MAHHTAAGENALQLLVDVGHLKGFEGEVLAGVGVALGKVDAPRMRGLARLDVFVHEPGELDERVVADPRRG